MVIPASNRQLKLMRLFGASVAGGISADEAKRAISNILADPANRARWDKYVFLTHDLTSESAHPKPFDPAALDGVVVPQGWYAARAEREYREEMAAKILKNNAPYDVPPPPVVFRDRIFLFTGRFEFGARTLCEQAVLDRGGLIPESAQVSHVIDYLVVGAKGSDRWKRGAYGSKIEAAVVERDIHGKPAIINGGALVLLLMTIQAENRPPR